MLKRNEFSDPSSCFNKATDDELIFVLLARDAAAPVAIRAWVAERMRLGLNRVLDKQLAEALDVAQTMEDAISLAKICAICWHNEQGRVPATAICAELHRPVCDEHASWCKREGHGSAPIER
jgi:hypothetical protein